MTISHLDRLIVASSELINYRPHIRARRLASLLGVQRRYVKWVVRKRIAQAVTVSVRGRSGYGIYWRLEDVKAIVRAVRERRRDWSSAEIRRVKELSLLLPIDEIAREIGRTPRAIVAQMERRGMSLRSIAQEYLFLTTTRMARLLGVTDRTVRYWAAAGCPHMHMPNRRREVLLRLTDVRQWLMQHRMMVARLSPETRALIRVDIRDGRVVDARKEREAA